MREKSLPKVWWIGEDVLPLHSQLKRTGLRRCLETLSGEQVLMDRVMFGRSYIQVGVRRTGEALEKNFSEYLVDSKSCCTFAVAT